MTLTLTDESLDYLERVLRTEVPPHPVADSLLRKLAVIRRTRDTIRADAI